MFSRREVLRAFVGAVATVAIGLKLSQSMPQIIESIQQVLGSDEWYAVVPEGLAAEAGVKTGDRVEGCFVVVV